MHLPPPLVGRAAALALVFLGLPVAADELPAPARGRAPGWLERVARLEIAGAEIVAHDSRSGVVLVTGAAGLHRIVRGPEGPVAEPPFDPARAASLGAAGGEVSHVAFDPSGSGVAAVTVIPPRRARERGKVVFFAPSDGRVLGAVDVGFNPDCCAFSADGGRLLVADEGEPEWLAAERELFDPLGTLTWIDLEGLENGGDFARLAPDRVRTLDLWPAARDAVGLRVHPRYREVPALDLEPESIAVSGDRAFVTLQENNALAVVDLRAGRVARIVGLGTIATSVDASDRDGGADPCTWIDALPMPDQVLCFTAVDPLRREDGPRTFLLTADEGDDRGALGEDGHPLADRVRLGGLAAAQKLGVRAMQRLDLSAGGAGRLFVDAFSGDEDGDGRIDRPCLLGARTLSVLDAESLERVAHTGDALERAVARRMPERFNATVAGAAIERDARSDDRGPEPEGLAMLEEGGRRLAFVTLERPGAIAVVDVTNPRAPRVLDVHPAAREGDLGPEGLCVVPAADGAPALLVVAYETSGTVGVYRIGGAEEASR